MSNCRIAVDIGGTFTDAILHTGDQSFSAKIPTTPQNPEKAFLDIITRLLNQANIKPTALDSVIHGTTIATNALIERRGARTAFITTKGFRDSLAIGYEARHDQYDLSLEKLSPLVPRHLRYTLPERILADGSVLKPIDLSNIIRLVSEIKRNQVESVAIGFLHAHVNPQHELALFNVLRDQLPNVTFSLSSQVCPEVREYERFSTTVADAYIKPTISRYLRVLENLLVNSNVKCPLFLVTSSGGLMDLETAKSRPIHLVESGPSGGAVLAELTARQISERKVVSFDMGGTTAKICMIDEYQSRTSREFEAARSARFIKGSGLPLRIPVTEMIEIGAGGGSIGSIDSIGRIRVGPQSAGSEPGPACYSRGGDQPTVTDANASLGRLDEKRFAEGRLNLDIRASDRSLQEAFSSQGFEHSHHAAAAMVEVVDENMANAARIHAVEHGSDLRQYTMVAFGGAGPLHACNLAEKLGIDTIAIPSLPGVGSALGFLAMPASCELSQSRYMTLGNFDKAIAEDVLTQLTMQAKDIVVRAMPDAPVEIRRSALMRYTGQGHDIEVELPNSLLEHFCIESLRQSYADSYKEHYGRELPGGEIEILTFTVHVKSIIDVSDSLHDSIDDQSDASPSEPDEIKTTIETRHVSAVDTPVYSRERLTLGSQVPGPALIVESQTTTVVSECFDARVDTHGNLLLERNRRRKCDNDKNNDTNSVLLDTAWDRLQSIVDEQAGVLMRTAFSPIVRESGDLSVGIFDVDGEMLTQAITGTPGHVNTMASACVKFFEHFPIESMQAGDIYLTNDPWEGSGHLNDFVLLKPCFFQGKVIGLISCTSHLVDIGGRCLGPDGNDVFDEGLYIPHIKVVEQGRVNNTLVTILKSNSRSPLQAEGDLYALIACCEHGDNRLQQMMQDFAITDLFAVSHYILQSSMTAVKNRLKELQDGEYEYAMTVDGYESPLTIKARLSIAHDSLWLDFYESAPPSVHGINVPLNYTIAYAVFGLKCAIAPDVPNNFGSLQPFQVSAAQGSILNAVKPAPVCSRHILGQLLPDVSLGCLAQILPERIPAEGAATLWDLPMQGVVLSKAETFAQELVFNGGTGARPHADGLSATAFPSGVMGSLVEITENTTPLLITRREYRENSGGIGQYHGGHGQVVTIEAIDDTELTVYGTVDRVHHPARGRAGGSPGKCGFFRLSSGESFDGKGSCHLTAGQTLTIYTPGGGGFGDSSKRPMEAVDEDKLSGLVTDEKVDV